MSQMCTFYWMYVILLSLIVNISVARYVWDATPYNSCNFLKIFQNDWRMWAI